MPAEISIEVVDEPSAADRSAIEALAAAGAAAGTASALNEAGLLNLRHPRRTVSHLLARVDGELVGYGQLERVDEVCQGQVVVAPGARRRGVGRALLDAMLSRAQKPLQLWAPGNPPAAAALARSAGLVPVRSLSIMTRSLDGELPEPRLPSEVTIRPFRPGTDEDAWLAVNARAFAHHPEQGRVTRSDLEERKLEDWFDPAGFLLAERDGRVIGFHWTKRHPGGLGEVYVIGVDPDTAGAGVGKALLAAGLRYLRDQGDTEVELYVESDHPTAIGLYTRAGFVEASRDVLYRTAR